MLNFIIRFSLHNRLLVLVLWAAALAYGTYVGMHMPIDVFPDLDRPRVVVMTECPGLAAEEVETLVTIPLESAFLGATGVQHVRSQSSVGLSVVYVEFGWNTNIFIARQIVQERLASATGSLPENVKPSLAPISSIMGLIMHVGLYRQAGPGGGALIPVGRTPFLAELKVEAEKGEATLCVWDPRDEHNHRQKDKAAWKPVPLPGDKLFLRWADDKETVVLTPQGEKQPLRFVGRDESLRKLGNLPGPNQRECRLTLTLADQKHELVFGSSKELLDLRTVADWIVRPRLLKVPGIAQITTMGGGRKQYQVLIDPDALFQHGVTLEEVETALKQNNLNASGGYAEQGSKELAIRVFGRLGTDPDQVLAEIRQIPVKQTDKRTIRIEQVAARVVEGAQLKRGDATINGRQGVLLSVTKQPNQDTRLLTQKIVATLEEIEATLPADITINSELFQMRTFIDRGITNVTNALFEGAICVLVVLFLFLWNLRTTFISLTAIPLSLVLSVLIFKLVGIVTGIELSINVMTLGGIAVAMGQLVDDAIVDVENIFRRLRENYTPRRSWAALRVVYEATVEICNPIVFGTLLVIMVFIPLFALSGMEGRLFTPLGIAYIISILSSLLVSMTVTPVLSYYLLRRCRAVHRHEDTFVVRLFKGLARPLINLSMARPAAILAIAWLTVGGAVWLLGRLGTDFLPPFDEGSVQVNVVLPPGSSLGASNQVCAFVDAKFQQMQKSPANPHGPILNYVRRTGRAELDEHADPVSNSEYILSIDPHTTLGREDMLREILEELKGNPAKKIPPALPGVDVEAEQPLAHLISHMLSGVSAQIAIKVYGDDLGTLRRLAEKIKGTIASVEGLTPPVIEAQRQIEEMQIRLRPDELAWHGISREHAAHYVQLALQGEVLSQVVEGQRRYDLLLRLDDPYRTDYAALDRLRLDVPGRGSSILLGKVADISYGLGPNVINRDNARRRLVVRCNVMGRDLGSVVGDIKQRIHQRVSFPPGYFVEYGGQFESQQEATLIIGVLGLVTLLAMFVLLYLLYPSWRVVIQILNALPAAFVGGVVALWLTNQTLTVAAMVGFVSLAGIAVRNGILLVNHYLHLMKHEGETFSPHMIRRGSLERLSPVLMTALAAILGLIPLVLGGQQSGREILYPVATVILGGLITSTLCEFLIRPGMFWRFSGPDVPRLIRHADEEEEVPVADRPAIS